MSLIVACHKWQIQTRRYRLKSESSVERLTDILEKRYNKERQGRHAGTHEGAVQKTNISAGPKNGGRTMIVKIKKNHRIMFKKIIIAFIIVIVLLTNETSCTVIKPHFKRGFSIPMSNTASGINYLQNRAKFCFHMYKGVLYALSGYSVYTVGEGATLKHFYTIPHKSGFLNNVFISFTVFINDKLYYCEDVSRGKENEYETNLWTINLDTKERQLVSDDFSAYAIPHMDYFVCPEPDKRSRSGNKQFSHAIIDANGVHYFNYSDSKERYSEEYIVGSSTLCIEYNRELYSTIYICENGEKKELLSRHDQYRVEQLSDGSLLIMNHLEFLGPRCIAWVYGTDGILHELMSLDGSEVHSCANVCNGYYYCSFYRFKDSHIFTAKKFKNDELEGTWKINLSTFEKTKISNIVYDGLFVFGDQIIGVDSSNRCCYIE